MCFFSGGRGYYRGGYRGYRHYDPYSDDFHYDRPSWSYRGRAYSGRPRYSDSYYDDPYYDRNYRRLYDELPPPRAERAASVRDGGDLRELANKIDALNQRLEVRLKKSGAGFTPAPGAALRS